MTPKAWREVELRREYLRGWRDGMVYGDDNDMCRDYSSDAEVLEALVLEVLNPCAWCGGDGKAHTGMPLNNCPCCGGTGIAKSTLP